MAIDQKTKQKLTFHYVKNNDFKTVFASGIIGGLNISGLINMNFFIDRTVIPRNAILEVGDDGLLSEIVGAGDKKDGVIREISCGVVMDVPTAKQTIQWLEQMISTIEKPNTTSK